MSDAWLTAVVAVLVAVLGIVGTLAGNWSSRRSLKDELEIARLVMDIYPDRIVLQQRISRRVSQRLAIMDSWTPLLPISVIGIAGYLLFVGEFFLGLAKPWLMSQGGLLGYLGAKYDRILIVLGVCYILFFAAIAGFPYLMTRVHTPGRRRTGTGGLAKVSDSSSSNETGGRLEGDGSMTSETAEPIPSPRSKEDKPDSDVRGETVTPQ